MSHLTKIETSFRNLSYLEKALNKLNIPNFKNDQLSGNVSLVLPQCENNNLTFNFNGEAFVLNVDYDYWNQKYSVNHFLSRITQEYATEAIVGESTNHGFQPLEIKEHQDGSRTISLQRWNQN